MFKELEDNEILNYLMTSEFTEGLTPDEFKFLLFKFRYFYRLNNGKFESLKTEFEGKQRQIENDTKNFTNQITAIQIEKAQIENQFDSIKNRNLTLKERFLGKIIINKDETQ